VGILDRSTWTSIKERLHGQHGIGEGVAIVGQGSIFDGIAYWVILAGIDLMVGGLMFYSGKDKLFDSDGNARQGSSSSSRGSSSTPFRAPTTRGSSFLPHRDKSLLQVGLSVALLTFTCMAFGQTATN
jgi:hypothetical protein